MVPRRRWLALAASPAAIAAVSGTASAHGTTGSRFDAPVPLPLLLLGAGATVALTALWLALGDRTGSSAAELRLGRIPAATRPVGRGLAAVFLLGVFAAVTSGLFGPRAAPENLATTFTWPVWIHGLALVSVLVGSPWRLLSPWRALYRGLVRMEGRPIALLAYPARLGSWPALLAFLALVGIAENLTTIPRSPRLTTAAIGAYALFVVVGAVLFGPVWLRRGDPLAVLYRLLGLVAFLRLREDGDGRHELAVVPPWRGCLDPVGDSSLVAVVVAAVYTVSFDGFAETAAFQAMLDAARHPLAAGPDASVLLYVAGFGAFLLVFAVASWLAERLGAGTGAAWADGARRFAPTVLPIAAGYEVAHNYPSVIRNLGALPAVAARPLGLGIDGIDLLGWLPVSWFWATQVVMIVVGHLVAVVAAHSVARDRYRSGARRGHLPFVVLMVGYTVLSLWIVSRPVVAE